MPIVCTRHAGAAHIRINVRTLATPATCNTHSKCHMLRHACMHVYIVWCVCARVYVSFGHAPKSNSHFKSLMGHPYIRNYTSNFGTNTTTTVSRAAGANGRTAAANSETIAPNVSIYGILGCVAVARARGYYFRRSVAIDVANDPDCVVYETRSSRVHMHFDTDHQLEALASRGPNRATAIAMLTNDTVRA